MPSAILPLWFVAWEHAEGGCVFVFLSYYALKRPLTVEHIWNELDFLLVNLPPVVYARSFGRRRRCRHHRFLSIFNHSHLAALKMIYAPISLNYTLSVVFTYKYSHNSFSGWVSWARFCVQCTCYAHLNILHEIYIHFNMYFKCYCCYYYNFNFINCVFCSSVLCCFFISSIVCFYCVAIRERENVCVSLLPSSKTEKKPCICVHILRFLVCGKEILLFLCVVVEYISLRVRELFIAFVANARARSPFSLSLSLLVYHVC